MSGDEHDRPAERPDVVYPDGFQPPDGLPPGLLALLTEGLTYEVRPMDANDPRAEEWSDPYGLYGLWVTLRRREEEFTMPEMQSPDAADGVDLAAALATLIDLGRSAFDYVAPTTGEVFSTVDVAFVTDRPTRYVLDAWKPGGGRVVDSPPVTQENLVYADGLRRLFGPELAQHAIDAYVAYHFPPGL